jgi:chemotaxis protein CheX
MPTELSAEIVPNELAQIVESVFETMLSLEVHEAETPWFPGPDRLTSAVQLTGEWTGAVLLECDREQSRRFAARFLSIDLRGDLPGDPPVAVDDVVRDVLGELANMIGGNLKCILVPGIRLSMPSVVDGSDYAKRLGGAEVRERLAFQYDESTFWITVLAARP